MNLPNMVVLEMFSHTDMSHSKMKQINEESTYCEGDTDMWTSLDSMQNL